MTETGRLIERLRLFLSGAVQSWYFLPVCLAIAFAVRVAWILFIDTQPLDDCGWYYQRAVDLAAGRGYVVDGQATAYWPVGYPAFLGLIFAVFGPSLFAAKIANVILQIGILLFTYQLGKRLFHSEITGTAALVILAFYPNHIAYSSLLVSEILFLFLLMLAVLLFIMMGHKPLPAAASGIVIGLACLVRPQAIFIPAIFFAVSVVGQIRRQTLGRHLRQFLIVHAALAATLVPWTLRNYNVFGHFVFVSTNGGINLLIGNNPYATGTYIWMPQPASMLEDAVGEYDRGARARKLAAGYIRKHPGRTIRLWRRKLWFLYRYDHNGIVANEKWFLAAAPDSKTTGFLRSFKTVAQIYYEFIGTAFLVSIVVLTVRQVRKRAPPALPMLGLWIVVYFTLIYLVFWGNDRFHFPMMPWIIMYAGALVHVLVKPVLKDQQ